MACLCNNIFFQPIGNAWSAFGFVDSSMTLLSPGLYDLELPGQRNLLSQSLQSLEQNLLSGFFRQLRRVVASQYSLYSSHPETNFLQVSLEGDGAWRDVGGEISKPSSHFSEGYGSWLQSIRQMANNNSYKLRFLMQLLSGRN